MWETRDPDERPVVLSRAVWRHILDRHEILRPHVADLRDAVRQPAHRLPGKRPNEAYFYLEGVGPSRWIKVVVHYEGDRERVVTAFPRRRFP